MAISIVDSKVYPNAGQTYAASHQLPDLAASGTDTYVIAAGYNRNPASDVSSWTIEGNTPTNIQDNINANVVAISVKGYVINNAATTVISNTPSFKLQNMIGLALTGVDQTTPITGTPVTFSDFNTNAIASYTGTAGNLLLVWVSTQGQKTFTASGCTAIATAVNSDSNIGNGWVGYVTATGSAQNIGATFSGGDNLRVTIVEVKAAAAGGVTVTPDTASLILTTFAPTVTATANQLVTPSTASLTLTTFAPVVTATNHQLVTPGTASLVLTTFAPTVSVSNNQLVTPGTASLTITRYAPTVTTTANQTVIPGTASLTLTTFAPVVSVTASTTVVPGTASLSLTTYEPTVTVSNNQLVTPDTASLVLTTYAPTVSLTANVTVIPGTASLVLTTFAPVVTLFNGPYIVPGTATLTLTTYAPVVTRTFSQRKYYLDEYGNIYWVLSETIGLVMQI